MTITGKTGLKEHVRHRAGKLDARVTPITMRPMKTKWASCSTAGCLTFDSALLMFREEVQD